MNTTFSLRNFYCPLQPTVGQQGSKVVYQEAHPHKRLSNLIYCYWQLKTTSWLETPFLYRVVADGCMDVFFQLDDPAQSFVMGFCNAYTEFPLENRFHYIGIRFFPCAFPALFNIDAKSLSNRYERLLQVEAATAAFIKNNFMLTDCFKVIRQKLDRYFLSLLEANPRMPDPRFWNAFSHILKNSGQVQVQTELETGLSPRQLRRYFEYYVGDTPKGFSQVVRFQQILNAKPSAQSLKKNSLFYELGYYDQAHFIKAFKTLYGTTPAKAF